MKPKLKRALSNDILEKNETVMDDDKKNYAPSHSNDSINNSNSGVSEKSPRVTFMLPRHTL